MPSLWAARMSKQIAYELFALNGFFECPETLRDDDLALACLGSLLCLPLTAVMALVGFAGTAGSVAGAAVTWRSWGTRALFVGLFLLAFKRS